MATYAIGDLQGCCSAFRRLLDLIAFDPVADRLWLVGDLVNRGPESLETLRFIARLGTAAIVVLGNHDLFLLMTRAGVKRRNAGDTLDQIFAASDCDELLHWLAQRPLLHVEGQHVLVHAGLLPQWTVPKAQALAAEVEDMLTGKDARKFLVHLMGSRPDRWERGLKGWDRLRVIVNAFTRMRLLTLDGRMVMRAKGHPTKPRKARCRGSRTPSAPAAPTPSSAATGRPSASTANPDSSPSTPATSGAARSPPCGWRTGRRSR